MNEPQKSETKSEAMNNEQKSTIDLLREDIARYQQYIIEDEFSLEKTKQSIKNYRSLIAMSEAQIEKLKLAELKES